jgi:hypothetical protein
MGVIRVWFIILHFFVAIVDVEGIEIRPFKISDDTIPAQDSIKVDTVKYWKTGGFFAFNVSQVSLINWAAGGENSVSVNATLNLTANFANEHAIWDNAFDFSFGRLKKQSINAIKTDDKIEIYTKYGRKFAENWFYSASLNVKTQIFTGFSFPEKDSVKISDFFSPGYLFLSMGIDFKPSDKFTLLISPVTGKTTVVKSEKLSNLRSFGVDSGKHYRHEFGGFLKLVNSGTVLKSLNYQLKIDAFSNYADKPANIDWDGELMILAKINKFFTANIKFNLIYDDDIVTKPHIGPRLQLKQFLGLGFSYKL